MSCDAEVRSTAAEGPALVGPADAPSAAMHPAVTRSAALRVAARARLAVALTVGCRTADLPAELSTQRALAVDSLRTPGAVTAGNLEANTDVTAMRGIDEEVRKAAAVTGNGRMDRAGRQIAGTSRPMIVAVRNRTRRADSTAPIVRPGRTSAAQARRSSPSKALLMRPRQRRQARVRGRRRLKKTRLVAAGAEAVAVVAVVREMAAALRRREPV